MEVDEPAPGPRSPRPPWLRRKLVAGVRDWRRSDVRAVLAKRRLRLDGLAPTNRLLLAFAGVAFAFLAVTLVVESLDHSDQPDLTQAIARITHPWPVLTMVALLTGFASTQLLLAGLADQAKGGRRLGLLMLPAVLGVVPLATTLRPMRQLSKSYGDHSGAAGLLLSLSTPAVVLGLVAVVAGVALRMRSLRRRANGLFVVPYLLLTGIWVCARLTGARLTHGQDDRLPGTLRLSTAFEASFSLFGLLVAGAGMLVTIWQVSEGSRAARDGAAAGAVTFARAVRRSQLRWPRRAPGPWQLLAALLAVKLVWVSLALLGALPGWLGGRLAVWSVIRGEDWLSWLLAGLIASVVVAWLARGCPGPRDPGGLVTVVAAVIIALALPELLFQALAALYDVGAGEWAITAAQTTERVQPWAPVAVVLGCAVSAIWRWARGGRGTGTVFLVAFALWGGVRLPALVSDLVHYPWFNWGLSMPSESTYGQHAGWVGNATIDLVLTGALLLLALAAMADRVQIRLVPALLVGLVTTVVVYPGMLLSAMLSSTAGNAAAFVLPFLYLYLFDAEALNTRTDKRDSRVLATTALSMFAVTVGVIRASRGNPVAEQDLDFAGALLVVPVLVTAVVTMLAPRRSGPSSVPQPELSR